MNIYKECLNVELWPRKYFRKVNVAIMTSPIFDSA
jgi:hypothetical protein